MKFFCITFLNIISILTGIRCVYSQNAASLPYSQFGFGELNQQGNFINRSFSKGGFAVANSINPNSSNPATYAYLDRTAAEFSLENRSHFFKTQTSKSFQNSVSFYNLTLAFPVSKRNAWALGFMPYSAQGYQVSYYQSIPDVGLANIKYQGEGNISRAFCGTSVKILRLRNDSVSFSLGSNFNFLFGSNYHRGSVEFNPSYNLLSTSYNSQSYYHGFYFDPSVYLHYQNKKRLVAIGLTYQLASNAKVIQTYYAQNYFLTISQTVSNKDVFLEKTDTVTQKLPLAFKGGFYTEGNHGHGFAMDFQHIKFNSAEFSKPLNTVSVTWQYDARKNNQNGFFKNTIYRNGFFYSQTNWVVMQKQINSFGFSSSFSFPTPGKFAYNRIQLGLTAGILGTTQNNLISQRFVTINAGILFGDIWFKRPKID